MTIVTTQIDKSITHFKKLHNNNKSKIPSYPICHRTQAKQTDCIEVSSLTAAETIMEQSGQMNYSNNNTEINNKLK